MDSYYCPQTKFAKVMFLQVSVCPHWGGMCGFIQGGHAWFFWGVCGFIWGACVVFGGGMRDFWGVCVVFSVGACVVFSVFLDTMRYGQ